MRELMRRAPPGAASRRGRASNPCVGWPGSTSWRSTSIP
jgi:hypothetical protein